MNYWLMKSEPTVFSIEDLKARPGQTEHWDGVRNYQARNMMRDQMKLGDRIFFYHSNCAVPGIVGVMTIVRESYPDHTAFDPTSRYFDEKSDMGNPRWFMVDVRYIRNTNRVISLAELKAYSALENMPLVRKGNRLSIMPVSQAEWNCILSLENVP
ncbi:MAG: EVE domain-containing protein [Proteobacteria bacterium]|nr:EVE domain-containing protein [Pseudomonadota bacterium]